MITRATSHRATQLFFYSFLILFTELMLIRWLGSNVVYLSYFSNFILLGSFFGIGMGFMLVRQQRSWYRLAPCLLAMLILLVTYFPVRIAFQGSGLEQLLVLGSGSYVLHGPPIWITLPALFLFVAAIMAAIAQGLALQFQQFSPLKAYRLDILGAMAGITLFSLMAYLNLSPVFWGAVIFIVFGILFLQDWAQITPLMILQFVALSVMLGVLGMESDEPLTLWSPYYKIALQPYNRSLIPIMVNNIPHQAMTSVAFRRQVEPFYFVPYQHAAGHALDRVLIIGAGSGTDTAIALSEGARQIDAVEIDPVIYQLGRELHPDHPYKQPNVNVMVNDGRAFLQQSHTLYDMIIFALPDSLTLVSGQSSLRLESYLFTRESLLAAKQHLKPGGVLTLYNYYWQPWVIDRLATTLQEVFHQTPCMDVAALQSHWLAVLMVSDHPASLHCATHWTSQAHETIAPITDNHPFLYLHHNTIPPLYLLTLFGILAATILITTLNAVSLQAIRSHADFFFMGMAFLLLETKSIVTYSLLFGNTWVVNALVFAGILLMVYVAIETTTRFPRLPTRILYVLLLALLTLAWCVPVHHLLSLAPLLRFIAATFLMLGPVYLANLIFAGQFQHLGQQSTQAFGINMIGAMIGGLLEYLALVTGYHFLLLLIAILYSLAFFCGQRYANARSLCI